MPNSSAICISGRPLDCNNAMASRLNSSVKLRRGFVIKHPSCPFPERNKGVHQFGGGSQTVFTEDFTVEIVSYLRDPGLIRPLLAEAQDLAGVRSRIRYFFDACRV